MKFDASCHDNKTVQKTVKHLICIYMMHDRFLLKVQSFANCGFNEEKGGGIRETKAYHGSIVCLVPSMFITSRYEGFMPFGVSFSSLAEFFLIAQKQTGGLLAVG